MRSFDGDKDMLEASLLRTVEDRQENEEHCRLVIVLKEIILPVRRRAPPTWLSWERPWRLLVACDMSARTWGNWKKTAKYLVIRELKNARKVFVIHTYASSAEIVVPVGLILAEWWICTMYNKHEFADENNEYWEKRVRIIDNGVCEHFKHSGDSDEIEWNWSTAVSEIVTKVANKQNALV